MNLNQILTQYITYRKSLGEKFTTDEKILKYFCKKIGPSIEIKDITENRVNDFLYGNTMTITLGWFRKHTALVGFYRYLLTRHDVITIPLPIILPKRPPPFIPYIYSQKELKLLFDTALDYQKIKSPISPYMVRIVLILTYALGLRIHETLSIRLGDIDLENLVLTIQQSKFYKSRLVPFNQEIKEVIKDYLCWRKQQNQPHSSEIALFIGKNNQPFNIHTMQGIFQKIRRKAGIKRDDASLQPRIHDLRHTFAVNRLKSWYQENKNVQQLLPVLSTYLGHQQLSYTSVYLTMTDDLLREANLRFEQYVRGEKQ